MSEIKPCPFCGIDEINIRAKSFTDGSFQTWIECASCHAQTEYKSDLDVAIDAWNARAERGTLTADQVRDVIERHSMWVIGNNRCFHNGAYEDIADELNTHVERTCHSERSDGWECSKCGFLDAYTTADFINYCPNCGAKVIGGNE